MSHCAQLSSALSSLSSMPPPPPTHTHSPGRDTALPPSAATMKKGQHSSAPPQARAPSSSLCPQAGRGDSWMVPRQGPRIAPALPILKQEGSHQG